MNSYKVLTIISSLIFWLSSCGTEPEPSQIPREKSTTTIETVSSDVTLAVKLQEPGTTTTQRSANRFLGSYSDINRLEVDVKNSLGSTLQTVQLSMSNGTWTGVVSGCYPTAWLP